MKIGLLVNAFARTKELDACLVSVIGASKGVCGTSGSSSGWCIGEHCRLRKIQRVIKNKVC